MVWALAVSGGRGAELHMVIKLRLVDHLVTDGLSGVSLDALAELHLNMACFYAESSTASNVLIYEIVY